MRRRVTLVSLFALLTALPAGVARGTPGQEATRGRPVAPAPAWFDAELAHRAVQAGPHGVALPAGAGIPVSSLAFLGIRPGSLLLIAKSTDPLQSETVSQCTANFLFTDGSIPIPGTSGAVATSATTPAAAGSRTKTTAKGAKAAGGGTPFAIGTAGHCGRAGDKVFTVFVPGVLAYIGDITKSTGDPGDRLAPDFALISIRRDFNAQVSPSLAHVGGPTGVYVPPNANTIAPILHSGHGLVVGTGGTPRAGLAYRWGDEYRFEGAVLFGDSGSAAIVAGGLAAGNVTHIAVDTRQAVPVWNGGTSIAKIMTLVGSYKLAICKSPVPWPGLGCPPA